MCEKTRNTDSIGWEAAHPDGRRMVATKGIPTIHDETLTVRVLYTASRQRRSRELGLSLCVVYCQFSDFGDPKVMEYVLDRLHHKKPIHFGTKQKGGQIQTPEKQLYVVPAWRGR